MKKKIVIIILIILTILESAYILNPIGILTNKVEKVKYESKEKPKMLAYMLGDGTGGYTETVSNEWPDVGAYAYYKAECYNGQGKLVDAREVLDFNEDTYTAKIKTKTSLYCYLYFDSTLEAVDMIIKNSGTENGSLETTADMDMRNKWILYYGANDDFEDVVDTLRRFNGTYQEVTDNFICFGTDEQNECLESTDKYMYRILGFDETNRQLKLLKATKIIKGDQDKFKWHNTDETTVTFTQSDIYKFLNSEDSTDSYFVGNPYYDYMKNSAWTSLIVKNPIWYVGLQNGYAFQYNDSYINERSVKEVGEKPIGLMYLSDVLFACVKDQDMVLESIGSCWLETTYGLNRKPNTSKNLDSSLLKQPTSDRAWTMSHRGNFYGYQSGAWTTYSGSSTFEPEAYTKEWVVRPIFYINLDIRLAGDGTYDRPYIIANIPD